MAQWLLRNDGFFVGSSSAVNCVGALQAARKLGPGHTLVTVLCDSGERHLSKFQSSAYLRAHGFRTEAPASVDELLASTQAPLPACDGAGSMLESEERAG
mmetsp:Transcript_10971/g.40232  ORF Transcript_10971/g.40232 Transcript_10971/m.40232 type:complete len:100 (-) Transcript_10971:249-548(-)